MRKVNLALFLVAVLPLSACDGPAGTTGEAGAPGPAGQAGPQGKNGNDGTTGQQGPAGQTGPAGPQGDAGAPGPAGCDGLNANVDPGLGVKLTVQPPAKNMFFAAGDQITINIDMVDHCGRIVPASAYGTLNLYMAGPRAPTQTKSASKLLNCIVDRAAMDHQHHYVNLIAPKFLDAKQTNLTTTATGLQFVTAPVSDEAAGTYEVGVWVKSKDGSDQVFLSADVQIGTATPEAYTTGDAQTSSCFACHLGTMSGKSNEMHSEGSASNPYGNYAIDETPVLNCKFCHNVDGYSPNPIIRKVHAVHRGIHQVNPGVAHPEYGLGTDTSLASFTDVKFPGLPNNEKDCTRCHVTDAYLKNPSRLACGTCHEAVFFDTGVMNPPRNYGKPYTGAMYKNGTAASCASNNDCLGFSTYATCDVPTGTCVRKTHPVETDDTKCSACHSADNNGVSPLPVKHDLPFYSQKDGVTLSNVVLSGGTGANNSFKAGDVPVVKFQLSNKAGAVNVLDANDPNHGNWGISAAIAGPTEQPFPVFQSGGGAINVMSATCPGPNNTTVPCLTYDANSKTYTFTFPVAPGEANPGWPVNGQVPLDSPAGKFTRQPNPSGSYTVHLWAFETLRLPPPNVANVSWRDASNFIATVRFSSDGSDAPVQPRQVIMPSACNGCHRTMEHHGYTRQFADGQAVAQCPVCHGFMAEDQGVIGAAIEGAGACTVDADCDGGAAGPQKYAACQNKVCVYVADPTPNQLVDFRVMIHQIHYARQLGGYQQLGNIPLSGKLEINGDDWSTNNFPTDVRNCTKCHADSGAACGGNNPPCGYGQSCGPNKTCVNTAWNDPFGGPAAVGRVCLACHDEEAHWAHVQINTWQGPNGPIESCEVCHGTDAQFSVANVHNVANPYKAIYPREPQ